MRKFPAIAALLLAGPLLALAPAKAETVYQRGIAAIPKALDPQKASTAAEATILRDLYEGLVARDAAGKLVPGIAEKWETAADGLTWTFRLREAKWSNGAPVTAGDFAYAFGRLVAAKSLPPALAPLAAIRGLKAGLKSGSAEGMGVKAVDDRTLEIALDAPVPALLDLVAAPALLPVSRAAIEAGGTDPAKTEAIVVNGPYRPTAYEPGKRLALAKNPSFHAAGSVAIDTVAYVAAAEPDQAAQSFEAGELASTDAVPAYRLPALRQKHGAALRVAPYLGTYFLVLDTATPPWSDARIRRALALAIDRKAIAEAVWGGAMLPAAALVPEGLAAYPEPAKVERADDAQADRVAAAKALLAEAGIAPPKPLKIELRIASSELNRKTAAAIGNGWSAIGVEASVVEQPAAAHAKFLAAPPKSFGAAISAWIADIPDADDFLELWQGGESGPPLGRYANPAYGALLVQAAKAVDPTARTALLKQADAMLAADLPAIPILRYASLNLVSPKLQGWLDNALDIHPTRYLRLSP